MLLFLDSNIICSNYYMAGPSFEVARKVGTIVLGQIVVDNDSLLLGITILSVLKG